jgi:hypothetical protein
MDKFSWLWPLLRQHSITTNSPVTWSQSKSESGAETLGPRRDGPDFL